AGESALTDGRLLRVRGSAGGLTPRRSALSSLSLFDRLHAQLVVVVAEVAAVGEDHVRPEEDDRDPARQRLARVSSRNDSISSMLLSKLAPVHVCPSPCRTSSRADPPARFTFFANASAWAGGTTLSSDP